MDVVPVVLTGSRVRLEPLRLDHLPALCAVGCDPELWRITVNNGTTPADMAKWVQNALDEHGKGTAVPFVTVAQADGQVIGSSRFGNIDRVTRRVEIGWTFVGRAFQRTGANREAKLLMLTHAFEVWRCRRVEFRTDVINSQSRNALLGIGATQEGILRKHQQTWTGRVRDTVFFSILDDEWPAARERLQRGVTR